MIEVIYKEDKEDQGTVQEPFSMPRNVRQIGLANGDYRIYIEDYVYTFLCSLAEDGETESQGNVAVLTGEIQWTTDMTCIYVKGALAADGMEATAEHIDFSHNKYNIRSVLPLCRHHNGKMHLPVLPDPSASESFLPQNV